MHLPKVSEDKTPLSPYDPPCLNYALFGEIFAKTSNDQIPMNRSKKEILRRAKYIRWITLKTNKIPERNNQV